MPPRAPECIARVDNRKCRRKGSGDPPLCEPCRAALAIGGAPAGIGSQLGSLLDQVMAGKKPKTGDLDQMWASVASSLAGRPISAHQVRETRQRIKRGDWQGVRATVSPPSSSSPWSGASPRTPPIDPVEQQRRAEAEHERAMAEARAHDIKYARQILGIGPEIPITEDLIKARQRVMARQHHPDRGGNVQKMQDVNHAVEVLRSTL